jgi:molybdate transport system regulatory protein
MPQHKTAPLLIMRIDFPEGWRLGRGKMEILDRIKTEGTISGAGRAMNMSYRRAWLLIDEMNRMFSTPVVVTQRGGKDGGKAIVTDFGEELLGRFRQMEQRARESAQADIDWLAAALRSRLAGDSEA